jgi:putative sigma-54 modulation protein
MGVHISGRGVTIAPALRRRVATKVAKVARFLPKITEVRVVLELERYRHRAEVTLQAKGTTLRAEGAGEDFHSGLDEAVENLAEQARRYRDRVRARKPRRARGAPPEPAGEAGPEPDSDVVIRRLTAKPLSVDEALEQIRGRADGLLVFTNARSRALNVLRRRPDGQLELVQPVG